MEDAVLYVKLLPKVEAQAKVELPMWVMESIFENGVADLNKCCVEPTIVGETRRLGTISVDKTLELIQRGIKGGRGSSVDGREGAQTLMLRGIKERPKEGEDRTVVEATAKPVRHYHSL